MSLRQEDLRAALYHHIFILIFRLYHCGRVAGKIFSVLAVIDLFLLWVLDWLFPRKVRLHFLA